MGKRAHFVSALTLGHLNALFIFLGVQWHDSLLVVVEETNNALTCILWSFFWVKSCSVVDSDAVAEVDVAAAVVVDVDEVARKKVSLNTGTVLSNLYFFNCWFWECFYFC